MSLTATQWALKRLPKQAPVPPTPHHVLLVLCDEALESEGYECVMNVDLIREQIAYSDKTIRLALQRLERWGLITDMGQEWHRKKRTHVTKWRVNVDAAWAGVAAAGGAGRQETPARPRSKQPVSKIDTPVVASGDPGHSDQRPRSKLPETPVTSTDRTSSIRVVKTNYDPRARTREAGPERNSAAGTKTANGNSLTTATQALATALAEVLPVDEFQVWGQGLRLIAVEPRRVVLGGAPNAFYKSRIEKQFASMVRAALRATVDSEIGEHARIECRVTPQQGVA